MDNNDSRGERKGDPRAPSLQTDDTVVKKERQEPVFSDFDEFDDFEEAERDTDYAAAYEDDGPDDEFDDENDTDSLATDWQVIGGATEPGDSAAVAARNPWAVEDDSINADPPASGLHAAEAILQEDKDLTRTDSADDWEDEDDYLEDEHAETKASPAVERSAALIEEVREEAENALSIDDAADAADAAEAAADDADDVAL